MDKIAPTETNTAPTLNQTLGGARPWPTVRAPGQKAHRLAVEGQAGIVIEIWWCPAHKGVAGNEKVNEWAKIAAEEPDTRGVEWLNYSD